MCFGVRDAIRTALGVPVPDEVTILGELVHNEQVNDELIRHGFQILGEDEREHLPRTRKVLVTAHGISNRERRRLEAAGKGVIDTTCPLVRRIHDSAQYLHRNGYFVIVIGKPDHVEVRGIVEDLDEYAVVSRPGDVIPFDQPRLGVICQSTTSPLVAQEVLEEIYAQNPGKPVLFLPTFCAPTRKRQAAISGLLHKVEAVVVVGGKNSNNTKELVRLANSRGIACLHIQNAADLDAEWFEPYESVGLTAGTSTPDETIEAVYGELLQIAFARDRVALVNA